MLKFDLKIMPKLPLSILSTTSTISSVKLIVFAIVFVFMNMLSVHAHSAQKTILVLGDSLSAEYGLARGTGWVSLLEKKLAAQPNSTNKQPDYKVVNASISGETSIGGLNRVDRLLEKYRPSIIIIELGGNDALRGLDLRTSENNFRSIIQKSQAKKAQVLLLAMQIPPNYGKQYTEQFFNIYAKLAKETKSQLVPFFLQNVADKIDLFQADRIHPIAEAHPIMLKNVWVKLEPMLKK